jgi:hypothetical protein
VEFVRRQNDGRGGLRCFFDEEEKKKKETAKKLAGFCSCGGPRAGATLFLLLRYGFK